jgi:hypothetical protein
MVDDYGTVEIDLHSFSKEMLIYCICRSCDEDISMNSVFDRMLLEAVRDDYAQCYWGA